MQIDQKRARTAVGVVLAFGLFGGGVLLGHASNSTSTTATPAPPPATSSGSTSGGGIGPARVVSGVPVGYQHTRSGALSAAANYSSAMGSRAILTPEGRAGIVSAIASPDAADQIRKQLDRADSTSLDQLRSDQSSKVPYGFASVPIAVKLEGGELPEGATSATVNVYAINFMASSTATAAGGYGQATVRLSWTNGDWKLAAFTTTSMPGPVPVGYYAPSTGWQPADGSSLYDLSSQFRRTMTDGTVPTYVIP
ncbi:hypothetical protein [Kitasatospora sp. NPDC001527]|uniref:hypothetical protein n=1 Tax=Kitasatospora sp. NPDC001527 TaxID=3154519 RepID=UPI003331A81D